MTTLLRTLLARLLPATLALGYGVASGMTPGPTLLIRCPGSDELRQVLTLGSGNTFGAKLWTDGYRFAPMLPEFPAITRCREDGPIFWVSSATQVGELSPWESSASAPKAWVEAPVVQHLSGEALLQAIAQGLGDTPERLAYLRLRAWWAANRGRHAAEVPGEPVTVSDFPAGSADRANLEALAGALDEQVPHQRLLKAEALRELARFEEAERLLNSTSLDDPQLRAFVTTIRQRTAVRDARVAPVKTER